MRQPSEPVELAPTETAGATIGLNVQSEGRRGVLSSIKEAGEASAEHIARGLGVTVGAVRQHLTVLEGEGLVAHRDERSGPGRPRRLYCITPAGESLWPKRYGQLTNQLLDFVRQESPELVDKVFTRRGEVRVERAATRLSGLDFDASIEELTRILDEDGYLADCRRESDGSWLVVEHNCAILDVARRYGAACASELAFLRAAMPDASVERIKHKMAGDFVCAYRITARAGLTR
ncbi:MAG TPA: ArsR family transcriptional regulator [Candidatus Dormibacteraeota bacterium]|nr:ArsR family transcriptional regulator [Candidatus Dormibacteraeota bacterium]